MRYDVRLTAQLMEAILNSRSLLGIQHKARDVQYHHSMSCAVLGYPTLYVGCLRTPKESYAFPSSPRYI